MDALQIHVRLKNIVYQHLICSIFVYKLRHLVIIVNHARTVVSVEMRLMATAVYVSEITVETIVNELPVSTLHVNMAALVR